MIALRDAIRDAERALEAAGVAECLADARLLLAHALGASPTWLVAHDDEPLAEDAAARYGELLRRRCAREPLQHLVGEQEFWRLRIRVSPAVLIPRPETELLVEWALERCGGRPGVRVADVGTGSGCLALALASELPLARIVAIDVSPEALRVARANARELGFEDRVRFLEGDLAAPLREEEARDVLVANLPYVPAAEWSTLEPEVRDHDPRLALVGGERGLELIERLIDEAPGVLAEGGALALEVGAGQAACVAARLAERGWRDVELRRDLAGIERLVAATRPA